MSKPSMPRPTALLREPLLWFVVLGVLIFVVSPSDVLNEDRGRIPVSAETVEAIQQSFEGREGRAPTPAELSELLEAHADEARALREAIELGLDESDPVIRRRLIQKLTFLDEGVSMEPSDEVLKAHRTAHADRYSTPERWDGVAILLASQTDPRLALSAVRAGDDPNKWGMARPHTSAWERLSREQISARTSPAVAAKLSGAPLNQWREVSADEGVWLMNLTTHYPSTLPPLDEMRERVTADWTLEERQRRADEAKQRRRKRWPMSLPRDIALH